MNDEDFTKRAVLVVAGDEDTRRQWSSWLEGYAVELMSCPGPQKPHFVCIGGEGKMCPLAVAADVVVLDMNLASDAVLVGTPSWQLLLYYLDRGCDVVAVTDGRFLLRWLQDERLIAIPRPTDPEDLIGAVNRFMSMAS